MTSQIKFIFVLISFFSFSVSFSWNFSSNVKQKFVKINTNTINRFHHSPICRRASSRHANNKFSQKAAVRFTADDDGGGGFANGNDCNASCCNFNEFYSNNGNHHRSHNKQHSTRNLDSFSTISEKFMQLNGMVAVGAGGGGGGRITLDCKMKLFLG